MKLRKPRIFRLIPSINGQSPIWVWRCADQGHYDAGLGLGYTPDQPTALAALEQHLSIAHESPVRPPEVACAGYQPVWPYAFSEPP